MTPPAQQSRPPWRQTLAPLGILFVVLGLFCFIIGAIEAFGAGRILGAPALGFIATGLAFWCASSLTG